LRKWVAQDELLGMDNLFSIVYLKGLAKPHANDKVDEKIAYDPRGWVIE